MISGYYLILTMLNFTNDTVGTPCFTMLMNNFYQISVEILMRALVGSFYFNWKPLQLIIKKKKISTDKILKTNDNLNKNA